MQKSDEANGGVSGAGGRAGREPGSLRLWAGWLLPVAGWVLHLYSSFLLVDWYCHNDTGMSPSSLLLLLHGATILALAVALAGVFIAWRCLRALEPAGKEEEGGVAFSRSRFLAWGGIILSVYLSVIIVLQGWANFFVVPCQ